MTPEEIFNMFFGGGLFLNHFLNFFKRILGLSKDIFIAEAVNVISLGQTGCENMN
jgi:hypothetical protein